MQTENTRPVSATDRKGVFAHIQAMDAAQKRLDQAGSDAERDAIYPEFHASRSALIAKPARGVAERKAKFRALARHYDFASYGPLNDSIVASLFAELGVDMAAVHTVAMEATHIA